MWLASENISQNYYRVVNESLSNNSVFNTFKSNPNYTNIVGMSGLSQGIEWYSNIRDNYKNIFDNLDRYAKNDEVGSPVRYNDIPLSPNTLRYINTLIEIEDYFKLKGELNFVELGVGYGGLCFVLNQFYKIKNYCLIDIPTVQSLASKYLDKIGIKNHTVDLPEKIDLFISEFCLSEFDDDGIYDFYDKYLIKSDRIYLHMNLHDEGRKSMFLKKLSDDFDYKISDEYPKTDWPNYVIRGYKK